MASSAAGASPAIAQVDSATLADSPAAESARVDQDDSHTVWKVPLGDSPVRGPADALVTIVEFGNFQCPFSKGVERTLRKLLEEFPEVRVVWKDDPLAIHSLAESAAHLAREARAEKGDAGFWTAHDALIEPAFRPLPANLTQLAKTLGLNGKEVAEAIGSRRYSDAINADIDLADDLVALGTPYFFINGRRIQTTITLDKLRIAIREELEHTEGLLQAGVSRTQIYDRIMVDGRGGVPLEVRAFRLPSVTTPSIGANDAKVFLLEFCDFTNFMCGLIEPTLDGLLTKYADSLGRMWLGLPDAKDPEARAAAIAARVAYRQRGEEGFKKMEVLLLEGQKSEGGLSSPSLTRYAATVGIDRKSFRKAFDDSAIQAEIDQETEAARTSGITTTPSFLVCSGDLCSGGGYYLHGGQASRSFEKRIRLVLQSAGGALPRTPR